MGTAVQAGRGEQSAREAETGACHSQGLGSPAVLVHSLSACLSALLPEGRCGAESG